MGINPFCQGFEYGASDEGYWTYDQMVLQLEDHTDILKALRPSIDFIFLFDNPCEHDRKREERFECNEDEQWIWRITMRDEPKKYQTGSWLPWPA